MYGRRVELGRRRLGFRFQGVESGFMGLVRQLRAL